MELFFNLLASLIRSASEYSENKIENEYILDDSCEKMCKEKVDSFLKSKFGEKFLCSFDKIPLTSIIVDDIIEWCKAEDNYYLYRILICRLDLMINVNILIKDYKFNLLTGENKGFQSLNNNSKSSGVIILPRVPVVETAYKDDVDDNKEYRRKNAEEFCDGINKHLQNCFYVLQEQLGDYTINNIILDVNWSDKGYINIGITPIWNLSMKKMLSCKTYTSLGYKGMAYKKFGEVEVNYPKEVEERFLESFRIACENNVDILLGPEMLGTVAITGVDEKGFNSSIRKISEEFDTVPNLIIPPTIWENKQNKLNIFVESGEKIGTQYKQKPYKMKTEEGIFEEDLVNISKELQLIHIPGVGRIAFSICMDFLNHKFHFMLASILKARIILCPSFSLGSANFEKEIDAVKSFNTNCIWVNSCSAVSTIKEKPDFIGLVSTSIVSECSHQRVKPMCDGKCKKGCLFTINMPLNCAGDSRYEECKPNVSHIIRE